jgi:hypothetical protein
MESVTTYRHLTSRDTLLKAKIYLRHVKQQKKTGRVIALPVLENMGSKLMVHQPD